MRILTIRKGIWSKFWIKVYIVLQILMMISFSNLKTATSSSVNKSAPILAQLQMWWSLNCTMLHAPQKSSLRIRTRFRNSEHPYWISSYSLFVATIYLNPVIFVNLLCKLLCLCQILSHHESCLALISSSQPTSYP